MQRYEEFELDDYIEDDEPAADGPGWDLSDDHLLRLHQCAIANRRTGGPDQGFPKLSSVLETKGLLEKRGQGWMITSLGQEIIRAQKQRLRRI